MCCVLTEPPILSLCGAAALIQKREWVVCSKNLASFHSYLLPKVAIPGFALRRCNQFAIDDDAVYGMTELRWSGTADDSTAMHEC